MRPLGKRASLTNILGLGGVAGALLFLPTFVSLHWLDPNVSVLRNYVSDYANGSYGRLFQASLLAHGLGNLAIAGGLSIVVSSRLGKWAAGLFGLASIGILVTGAFATDPEGVPRTIAGTIHLVAAFAAFPIETLALLLFAYAFRQLPSWTDFVTTTVVVALLSVLSLTWLLFAISAALAPGPPERISFLTLMAWEIAVGARLMRA